MQLQRQRQLQQLRPPPLPQRAVLVLGVARGERNTETRETSRALQNMSMMDNGSPEAVVCFGEVIDALQHSSP